MNEIKFKAWDTNLKVMRTIEAIDFKSGRIYYNNGIEQESEDVLLFKILQFVGKQDKDGIDIYVGDVCQREDTSVDYVIKWDDNLGFVANEIGGFDCFVIDSNYKIIGNIYDNPELLNQK